MKLKYWLGYYHERLMPPFLYPLALKNWFKKCTGRKLNLKNPVTFDDKINWVKLYGLMPEMTTLSDKYAVRSWVAEKIGEKYLVPLLGVWNRFEEIDFDALPERFVLKTNNGSETNIIVTDKAGFDKAAAAKKFRAWLKMNFAFKFGYQLQYRDIPPKIIAEEYIDNGGNNLYDYKVHCFSGVPKYIEYIGDRHTSPHEIYMDTKWNKQDFYDAVFPQYPEIPPKPERLDELLSLAETLSQGFPYVRTDFYILNSGEIKFGEMTFTPGSGQYTWQPESADIEVGKLMKIPY
ncbi:MAG: glycosyl transferase [Lachnospiraceae bacterium]|nr:glycosyl transferase [Lachnospiraceae bacterium]